MSHSAARRREMNTANAPKLTDLVPFESEPQSDGDTWHRLASEETNLAVETALAVKRLDKLILGRIHDLDILKALSGNLKVGPSQAGVHNQLLALARSAREAFHALQDSRDALIALHRKSIGGETVAVVDNITGLPNRASFEARLVPGGDPVIQMLSVTIGISGNKPEDQSWADLFQRARHSLLLARKQVGAGIYIG